jgi:hypothetical protein
MVISQTKAVGRLRIRGLLDSLGLSYAECANEFRVKSPQLLRWMAANFIREKDVRKTYYVRIPRWFYRLNPSHLRRFLDGVIGGDGSKHSGGGGGFQVYTASEGFAEDLVELCLVVGKCANIYPQDGRTRIFPNGKTSVCGRQYVVSIVSTREHLFDRRTATKKDIVYAGNVYCVKLPKFHRLYVMREGKAFWCGNSHEIVRHRIASYSQESTRYCDYKGGMAVVDMKDHLDEEQYKVWSEAMEAAERSYLRLREMKVSPQLARSVLPNSLKTELVMTANLREWRLFFRLRTSKAAHPQMREVAGALLRKFKEILPVVFEDMPEN